MREGGATVETLPGDPRPKRQDWTTQLKFIKTFRISLQVHRRLTPVKMLREASLVGLAAVVILAYGIDFLFSYLDDPREPRRVTPKVPVIGHFLGLLRYGWDYYSLIR